MKIIYGKAVPVSGRVWNLQNSIGNPKKTPTLNPNSESASNSTMIIIHDYKTTWPEEFELIRSSLLEIMGSLALRIDHIGSTSVPGLGAKDVIDIQITVQALTSEVKERLIQAGYEHWPTITRDHVPLGEDADAKLWAKFFFNEPKGRRRANMHVRVEGAPNQRYPLLFRDYLRVHANSARSIDLIKREIAKHHADDIDTYYDIKDPVYDLIWEAARNWSRDTGGDSVVSSPTAIADNLLDVE